MNNHYHPPEFEKNGFTCPYCDAYSAMSWSAITAGGYVQPMRMAKCHRCGGKSIWFDGTEPYPKAMVFPPKVVGPVPNEDLPPDCKSDYEEARAIAGRSPRGAAALLRLCIQKLVAHLGGEDNNLNHGIGTLVVNGMPKRIQAALDVVRVVGNNAVHPGEMSVKDDPETVNALFGLVNLIVENQITQPKEVAALFEKLPEGAKAAIERRDTAV